MQLFLDKNISICFVCSTVASALNSLAAITIKDFLDAGFKVKIAENNGAFLSKWISVIFGAISFLLIFIVKQMDSVLKVSSLVITEKVINYVRISANCYAYE